MNNSNLAEEYSSELIRSIIMTDTKLSEDEQMPVEMINFWIEEIKSYANITVEDYLKGTRDDYKFSEAEMMDLLRKATESYTQTLLNGLVDKGLVEVSVNSNGDLLYGLTDDGKGIVKDL